ncbi:hydroxyacid dehydrogenase [Streptomyces sp. NPDC088762]|uniref:hydroxyacid dehydrogenase n=1 Tax=Streptomyces sp. NPDC088762 TaxID=3365891 RepID=UPI003804CBCE
MAPELLPRLLDDAGARRLHEVAALDPECVADDFRRPGVAAALAEAEVLLTFWGAPAVDARALAAAPRLKAVVHAAGSVKHLVTDACWERGITVSSAALANSLPVAEYTVAMVLLSNKRVLELREEYRSVRGLRHDWHQRYGHAGNYRRTVGIVGASRIGRRVIELLRPYDLELLVYDPYLTGRQAERLGARGVGLDELCRASDVVSLHAPALPETRAMIDRRRLALMRDGVTLINTARGALVDGPALTEELVSGRLRAVIDVTEPEVLPAESPLYDLPNVLLTPHIAGSLGNELHRMADSAIEEIARYAAGLPFAHGVRREDLDRTA